MTRFTKWMARSIASAVALSVVNEGWTQYLTGTDRSSFVTGAVNGCMRKKDTDTLTAAMPLSVYAEYCRCYANGLADRATMSDLRAGDPTVMRPIIKEIAGICIEAARKSMPQNQYR